MKYGNGVRVLVAMLLLSASGCATYDKWNLKAWEKWGDGSVTNSTTEAK